MQSAPPIIISTHDVARLEAVLESVPPDAVEVARALEGELVRADVREPADMPTDVVSMHSKVLCVDEASGVEHTVRLVFPREAERQAGDISVLAPVGAALIGLTVGQTIDWPLPGGKLSRIRVSKVLSRPDAV